MGKITSCIVPNNADIDSNYCLKPVYTDSYIFAGLPTASEAIYHYFSICLNNQYSIPKEIVQLCCRYCGLQHRYPLLHDSNVSCGKNIVSSGKTIRCNHDVSKITIFGDLIMESNSKIEVDTYADNYQLILNVFGHFQMKYYSEIATKYSKCGNIYINCNKFTMGKYSTIQCCNKIYKHDSYIELNSRTSIVMKPHSRIFGSNINVIVNCQSNNNAINIQTDKKLIQTLARDPSRKKKDKSKLHKASSKSSTGMNALIVKLDKMLENKPKTKTLSNSKNVIDTTTNTDDCPFPFKHPSMVRKSFESKAESKTSVNLMESDSLSTHTHNEMMVLLNPNISTQYISSSENNELSDLEESESSSESESDSDSDYSTTTSVTVTMSIGSPSQNNIFDPNKSNKISKHFRIPSVITDKAYSDDENDENDLPHLLQINEGQQQMSNDDFKTQLQSQINMLPEQEEEESEPTIELQLDENEATQTLNEESEQYTESTSENNSNEDTLLTKESQYEEYGNNNNNNTQSDTESSSMTYDNKKNDIMDDDFDGMLQLSRNDIEKSFNTYDSQNNNDDENDDDFDDEYYDDDDFED